MVITVKALLEVATRALEKQLMQKTAVSDPESKS